MEQKVFSIVGKSLYRLRFLMSGFYIGLIVILCATLGKFLVETFTVIEKVIYTDVAKIDLIIKVLELVDMTMVAQLIWVVALAGFSLFVTDAHFEKNGLQKPDWLEHVNTYSLKLKLGFAMISISGVHALKTYLQEDLEPYNVVLIVSIHLMFVLAAIGIAYAEHITTQSDKDEVHK